MALTLSTVRSRVRGHVDEPTANYWSDAELNGYISDSELDLWTKILALKKDYWLTSVILTLNTGVSVLQGGDSSGMPSDIWRVEAIRPTTSGSQNILFTPADPNSAVFLAGLNTDFPVYNPFQIMYALRNITTLALSPVIQNGPLQASMNYIQQPTPMVLDTDTFLIPDTFMRFVQYNAAATALSKGPVGDSVSWAQRAAQAWTEIREAMDTPRSSQGPDLVVGFGEG